MSKSTLNTSTNQANQSLVVKNNPRLVNHRPVVVNICTEVDNSHAVYSFLEFRKRFFVDGLGWSLSTFGNLERDEFDTKDAVYCVLRVDNETIGGWRAIPTNRPYLSQSIFSELAVSYDYPNSADTWEISRFGLMKSNADTRIPSGLLYALMFQFALARHLTSLVAIADLFHERLLNRLRVVTTRYGPPATVGHTRDGSPIEVVAGEIPIYEQDKALIDGLLAIASKVEVIDETLVLRPERISA